MAAVADFKEEYQPQSWERLKARIRTRLSVWIGLAAFVGWIISRILPKKRGIYVSGSIQQANHRSGDIKPAGKSKQRQDQGGLLSLVLELLGAVAISLVQRYFKSWRSTLIVKLHHPPEPKLSSTDLPKPSDRHSLPDHGSETSPEMAGWKSLTRKISWRYSKTPPVNGSRINVPNSAQLWPTSRFSR